MAQIITCDVCGTELSRFVGFKPADEKSKTSILMRARVEWGDNGITFDLCEPCMRKHAATIPPALWPDWLRKVMGAR